MFRETKCKALRQVVSVKKNHIKNSIVTKKHNENRLPWAKKYMNTDFRKVLFTDDSRITLNEPDGWNRKATRWSIKIWEVIIGNELLGSFKVGELNMKLKRIVNSWRSISFNDWMTNPLPSVNPWLSCEIRRQVIRQSSPNQGWWKGASLGRSAWTGQLWFKSHWEPLVYLEKRSRREAAYQ